MKKYSITPLLVGTNIRDCSQINYGDKPGTKHTSPVISWYITDEENKARILVDTGGDPPDGVKHMPYFQEPDQLLDVALRAHGVEPEEITDVILTHLHWDHASNNHMFPNAKFYVQKKELQWCVAPVYNQVSVYDLPVIFKTKYEILDGDVELFDGIRVILTPGHSDGSQTVLVDTEDGVYGIVGDLFNTYSAWESKPRMVNGLHTCIQTCIDSYAKLEKYVDYVLPGHDFKVFEHSKYPPEVN